MSQNVVIIRYMSVKYIAQVRPIINIFDQCSLTFIVYRSLCTHFSRFYLSKLRPDIVFEARWCRRRNLMSSIHSMAYVFYRWSVDVFRLSCTVNTLFDVFGCALEFGCKFALGTNVCKFYSCNDSISKFLPLIKSLIV
jgi:hypothetical protein